MPVRSWNFSVPKAFIVLYTWGRGRLWGIGVHLSCLFFQVFFQFKKLLISGLHECNTVARGNGYHNLHQATDLFLIYFNVYYISCIEVAILCHVKVFRFFNLNLHAH